jgi:bifunctional aspartokinase / homoserine dehydrogenase 1
MQSKPKVRQTGEFRFRVPSAQAQHGVERVPSRTPGNKPLQVMKFGGTSVGNAARIATVAEIIGGAARKSSVVVVVSAMSGVTNKLMEAAAFAEAGNSGQVAAIFRELRVRHEQVADALITSSTERRVIGQKMRRLFHESEYLCQAALLANQVTSQTRDSIASLGERLCAPLVAGALMERGIRSEAITATELISTDANYGAADPYMDATREQCDALLRPLLHRGTIPVVTGFIGATPDGVLTTLGRGGSDYSATILGAALGADEVIIWTDVDGVLTADPRLVPGACTIPEISYRQAADLAHFGAKVLHPKTLQPVMQSDIPVWIRNSFAPEQPGTKISPTGVASSGAVIAVTTINEAQLVTVSGADTGKTRNVHGRARAAVSEVRADTWLTAQSGSRSEVSVAVSPALAEQVAGALREEFAEELAHGKLDGVALGGYVAIVTLVGQDLHNAAEIRQRSIAALGQAQIEVLVIAEESCECNLSLVVSQRNLNDALLAMHQEFRLGELDSQFASRQSPLSQPH